MNYLHMIVQGMSVHYFASRECPDVDKIKKEKHFNITIKKKQNKLIRGSYEHVSLTWGKEIYFFGDRSICYILIP